MDSINLIKVNDVNDKEYNSFSCHKIGNIYKKTIKIIIALLIIIYLIFIFKIYIYLAKISSNIIHYEKFIQLLFENIIKNKSLYIEENKYKNNYLDNLDDIKTLNAYNIIQKYTFLQNDFCKNPNKYYNKYYEDLIGLTNFSSLNLSYQIYVYQKFDKYMSNEIKRRKSYEKFHMHNFLEALRYYSEKNNIKNNKDIFVLDIGGNIGAYPSFLGRFGYSILSFEASPRNYYILNKNYCLIKQKTNIIIINKGISNEDKNCNYYSQNEAIGNGILLCNENRNEVKVGGYIFNKTFNIDLMKLSTIIPYFSNKNLALIKMDIEGGEGKVIEDAIELINKFHVPYIFSEYNTYFLKRHGTDPKKFLQLFIDNGYKISVKGFLSKSFISIDDIKPVTNLYFIYSKD